MPSQNTTGVADYRSLLDDNLELLRCIECPDGQLSITTAGNELQCDACDRAYEVTDDFIPVMLPLDVDPIREANIEIYDSISDEYQKKKVGNPPPRLVAMFGKAADGRALDGQRHLDFGCGPGSIIHWLRDYGLRSIGLDVSLSNLRNTRDLTGAFVVCADATRMPFASNTFGLVTETAVLHHLNEWSRAVAESIRVATPEASIVLDSEPSKQQMAISGLARFVYGLRKPVYGALSKVWPSIGIHNHHGELDDIAETHNQPGAGIGDADVVAALDDAGFTTECVYSPNANFEASVDKMNAPRFILNVLSFRNPWDPANGTFSIVATRS